MLSKSLFFASAALGARYLQVKEPIDDSSFTVVFKKDVEEALLSKHMEIARGANATIVREFNIGGTFKGYSAVTDKRGLEVIMAHDSVDYVEQDGVMRALDLDTQQCSGNSQVLQEGLWGLARTASLEPSPDYTDYTYGENGADVNVYVLDTGIYLEHVDFENRAVEGFTAFPLTSGDRQGHGTHCAGTIGGRTYGVAKQATLIAVKVLGDSGAGSIGGIVSGMEYAAEDSRSNKVASMSLGGGFSQALNDATTAAIDAGVVMVVASGNSNTDACDFSPAGTPRAITVNSIARGNERSSFSNYGGCSDIFAPGTAVLSAWIDGPTSSNTISGTSMACPHVAGQVAKNMGRLPGRTPDQVKQEILADATMNMVTNPMPGSPNRILYGC